MLSHSQANYTYGNGQLPQTHQPIPTHTVYHIPVTHLGLHNSNLGLSKAIYQTTAALNEAKLEIVKKDSQIAKDARATNKEKIYLLQKIVQLSTETIAAAAKIEQVKGELDAMTVSNQLLQEKLTEQNTELARLQERTREDSYLAQAKLDAEEANRLQEVQLFKLNDELKRVKCQMVIETSNPSSTSSPSPLLANSVFVGETPTRDHSATSTTQPNKNKRKRY